MLMATRLRRRPNAESEEGARGGVARTVARVQTRQPTIGWIDDSVSVGRTRGRTCRLPPNQPRYGGETEAKLSLLSHTPGAGGMVVDRVGVAGQFDGSAASGGPRLPCMQWNCAPEPATRPHSGAAEAALA
jgi:hypothetical protein